MAHKESPRIVDTALVGFGVLIGAGLALLLFPLSACRAKQESNGFTDEVAGKVNEAVYEFTESIDSFVAAVEVRSNEILHNGEELTQESKEELLEALDKGRENLAQLKERLVLMIG
jgi:gas vesicle protein